MDNGTMQWDIFCRVIDNFGDMGVCWRLSADLAARGHAVRLWTDDASALQWMAPGVHCNPDAPLQVLDWKASTDGQFLSALAPADVWVEGFGCEIDPAFIANRKGTGARPGIPPPVWINLEYLSAQSYAARSHGLPSPVLQGPGQGWTKHFFYPGFFAGTGGLLREPDLARDMEAMNQTSTRAAWLESHGVVWHGEPLVSLFCYEPPALGQVLRALDANPRRCNCW
jgi:uncharacterized repeat protein (TIGR03837 family)